MCRRRPVAGRHARDNERAHARAEDAGEVCVGRINLRDTRHDGRAHDLVTTTEQIGDSRMEELDPFHDDERGGECVAEVARTERSIRAHEGDGNLRRREERAQMGDSRDEEARVPRREEESLSAAQELFGEAFHEPSERSRRRDREIMSGIGRRSDDGGVEGSRVLPGSVADDAVVPEALRDAAECFHAERSATGAVLVEAREAHVDLASEIRESPSPRPGE